MSQPDYLIVLFPFIAEILRRTLGCIMDIYYLSSNDAHPSRMSCLLEPPSSDQEDPHQHARSNHQGCGSTLTEKRSCMAAPQLVLSRKRSIHSLVSEHLQNAQASDARPPSTSRPSKRTREPKTPVSPAPHHLKDHESANYAPRPLLQSFEPIKACSAEQQASLKYQTKSASLRTLSSPIKFNDSIESFATSPNPDSMDYIALWDQSKYLYYPPTNPSEGAQPFSRLHNSGPYRRLSYGELSHSLDSRAFHTSTASRGLRRRASLRVKHHNCLSFYHHNPEAIQAKTWNSEPAQPKPRLWLDLAEDEEIGEKVSLRSLPNQRTRSWLQF